MEEPKAVTFEENIKKESKEITSMEEIKEEINKLVKKQTEENQQKIWKKFQAGLNKFTTHKNHINNSKEKTLTLLENFGSYQGNEPILEDSDFKDISQKIKDFYSPEKSTVVEPKNAALSSKSFAAEEQNTSNNTNKDTNSSFESEEQEIGPVLNKQQLNDINKVNIFNKDEASLITEKEVDIYKLPDVDTQHILKEGSQIVIGDLHANAMRLLFTLFKQGIASGITETDYLKLVKIYNKETEKLDKNDIDQFNNILKNIDLKKSVGILLLGDELADRGSNDYFILKILNKLHDHNVPFTILVSNHGAEFMEGFDRAKGDMKSYRNTSISISQSPSAFNLKALVTDNKILPDEIKSIINFKYRLALKLLDYSLSEDKKNITLYSHAPIGLDIIKEAAESLGVEYKDDSAEVLALTIDKMNEAFKKKYIYAMNFHKIYELSAISKIANNRDYDNLSRSTIQSSYEIKFVHGHDKNLLSQDVGKNIINLDSDLGKSLLDNSWLDNNGYNPNNKGEYKIFYTPEQRLSYNNISLEIRDSKENDTNDEVGSDTENKETILSSQEAGEEKVKPEESESDTVNENTNLSSQAVKEKASPKKGQGRLIFGVVASLLLVGAAIAFPFVWPLFTSLALGYFVIIPAVIGCGFLVNAIRCGVKLIKNALHERKSKFIDSVVDNVQKSTEEPAVEGELKVNTNNKGEENGQNVTNMTPSLEASNFNNASNFFSPNTKGNTVKLPFMPQLCNRVI